MVGNRIWAEMDPSGQEVILHLPVAIIFGEPGISGVSLSKRERQIAELMVMGLCGKEIAAKLNISIRTVKFHKSNIYARMGVPDERGLLAALAGNGARAEIAKLTGRP